MLTNERERKICAKYSKRDDDGHVHCFECPLRKYNEWDFRCKATSSYNRHTRKWEYDYKGEEVENGRIHRA